MFVWVVEHHRYQGREVKSYITNKQHPFLVLKSQRKHLFLLGDFEVLKGIMIPHKINQMMPQA